MDFMNWVICYGVTILLFYIVRSIHISYKNQQCVEVMNILVPAPKKMGWDSDYHSDDPSQFTELFWSSIFWPVVVFVEVLIFICTKIIYQAWKRWIGKIVMPVIRFIGKMVKLFFTAKLYCNKGEHDCMIGGR